MMLSKLGALDSAQSTEYLTAILNGFNMKGEDAVKVVDKLVAIKYPSQHIVICEYFSANKMCFFVAK